MRGQEILSGAQRVHDAEVLKHRMSLVDPPIDPAVMKDYVNAFEYGAPPHAGAGLGISSFSCPWIKLTLRRTRPNCSILPQPAKHSPRSCIPSRPGAHRTLRSYK
jgi:hypothetical protein